MLLKDIKDKPIAAFDYMERQVNKGSLSGYTEINTTLDQTNPFKCEGYNVLKLVSNKRNIENFGEITCVNDWFDNDESIYIHPDWLLIDKRINDIGVVKESLWVIPTSSSRTVRVEKSNIFLKLHYPGVLGRLERNLGYQQLISGIEITSIFEEDKKMAEFQLFLIICRNHMEEYFMTNRTKLVTLCVKFLSLSKSFI